MADQVKIKIKNKKLRKIARSYFICPGLKWLSLAAFSLLFCAKGEKTETIFNFTIDNNHAVVFPSKLVAGQGGEHIVNIRLAADCDNGVIRSIGDWVDFDVYAEAAAPQAFEGIIRGRGTGTKNSWYVEVVTPADAVLIDEVELFTNTYDQRFTDKHNWYNPEGATVRGYILHKYDIFERSVEGFDGTPAEGATVTADATTGKLVVA